MKKLLKENQALKKQIIELKAIDANRLEAEKLLSVQRDIAVSLGSARVLTDVLDQILEATFQTSGSHSSSNRWSNYLRAS